MPLLVFGVAVIVVLALASLVMTWPFMWVWNYAIVSAISVANPISYWVAFWLNLFLLYFLTRSGSNNSME